MNANAQTAAPWQNAEIPQDHLPEISYPLIQWVHGGRRDGSQHPCIESGGFMMTEDQRVLTGLHALPGFQPGMVYWRAGNKDEACHVSPSLDLAVIAYRRRWETVKERQNNRDVKEFWPWNEYEQAKAARQISGKPRGKYHFMVLIRGMEAAGPMVITSNGTTSKALMDTYKAFADTLVKAAESLANKRFPGYAFWMTVSSGPQVIEETSRMTMTYPFPGWQIPQAPDARRDYLYGLYTGDKVLAQVAAHWETAQAWRHTWDHFRREGDLPDHDPNPTYTQAPVNGQGYAPPAQPAPVNGQQQPAYQTPPAHYDPPAGPPPPPNFPEGDEYPDADGIPF